MTDRLFPGEELHQDKPLVSADGRFRLVLQSDGNLVMYDNGNHAYWATNTGEAFRNCVMQSDGNLVLYRWNGTPIWSSGSWGHPGSTLVLQNDRNLVIYEPNHPVWASGTNI